jgi:mono/diheme cytochrome c family protein
MNIKPLPIILLLFILGLMISGCNSEPTAAPYTPKALPPTLAPTATEVIPGDPVAGKAVFDRECADCHSTDTQVTIEGPTLYQAGNRLTQEYVRESIVDPNKPVEYESEADRPPLNAPTMPEDIADHLTASELENVIAYVMSLK